MPVFSHMLIPLDGSRLAEVALPTAFGLAAGVGARVTLLHVLEVDPPRTVHGEPHLLDSEHAERYLASVAERYAATGTGLHIDYHVHTNPENDVAASIVGHAEELGADLVALTPHGRGDLRRWLIGSIPQIVLQRGNSPVLLIPTREGEVPPFQLRNLLVPLEGHVADTVLRTAQEISGTFGAQTHLLHVVPVLSTLKGDNAPSALLSPISTAASLDLEEETIRQHLSDLIAGWPTDSSATARVLRGEPANVILKEIERSQPDLVLMSTHGRSGLRGLWAASVAAKVVARSPRPMLLLRVTDPEPGPRVGI